MRTRLLFVRHGDSLHKREGVIGGPNGCRGLTDTGREQAALLGQQITAEIGNDKTTIYRSFDLKVSPASITEWVTDQDPTQWPPPRWTLIRFNETPAFGGGTPAPG
ncbi:phosphoglycerate mutase family protein [Nonomuraea sp. NPDC049784]|uniref:phosphoglycerate mutase family protein n=1 Tax=Nonomuraea sp. NPDC049784 TaxID=3154361 RepID=UPI0033D8A86A